MATIPTSFAWRSPTPASALPSDVASLDRLPASLLELLERSFGMTSYAAGTIIVQEGACARGIYIVRRGQAIAALTSRSGKRLVLKSARVGDILGASACLLGKPHAATVESCGPSLMSFIPKPTFLRLMRTDNELCFHVARHLSAELDHACRDIDLIALARSAEQKLAAFLLQLFEETKAAPPRAGDSLHLRLTHQELSHRVGLARESVTRALRRLRQAKIIEIHRSVLRFRELDLLRHIAAGKRLTRR